jgi:regulator of protease activity HflC (stomatin/prohibitin superfamily)
MDIQTLVIGGIIASILLITAYKSILIVNEDETKAAFVLGSYKGELDAGVNLILPFITKTRNINTKIKEISVPRITEVSGDNKRVNLECSVYCSVNDPQKFLSLVSDYEESIWKITKSEFTSIITESEAEGFRRNQKEVESEIRDKIQNSVNEWGIQVERVDMTDISVEQRE